VTTCPAKREAGISATGMVAAPPGPGVGLQPGFEYPAELEQYVVDLDEAALLHRDTGAS
jgi:hypothetical protein